MRIMTIASLALLSGMAQAWAADADNGGRLAQRWCAACHVIGAASHGQDTAPTLPPVSARRQDRQWLRGWLSDPHPPMPDLHLSRQEIDDIIAYLATLPPSKDGNRRP